MRPIVMRPIILAASVLAAACSDQTSSSPTSPVSVAPARAHAQSQGGVQLPFRGSLRSAEASAFANGYLLINGSGEGTATHLGRFAATIGDIVNPATRQSTGTFNLTAANGDQLFTTTAGGEVGFDLPNISYVTVVATIVGGTGRFANAAGSFTVRRTVTIDFATNSSTSTGSFEGRINLNN